MLVALLSLQLLGSLIAALVPFAVVAITCIYVYDMIFRRRR
jgi:hypothetical protein